MFRSKIKISQKKIQMLPEIEIATIPALARTFLFVIIRLNIEFEMNSGKEK